MSEQQRQDREREMKWLKGHSDVFWWAAFTAYEASGRGALIIDARQWSAGGEVPEEMKFGYFPQADLEQQKDEIVKRMVREYDPTLEYILVLLKSESRMTTYRIQKQLDQSAN